MLADYQRAAVTADAAERAMWAARPADMLGYVLDVARLAQALTPYHLRSWRRPSPDGTYRDPAGACQDCEAHPASLCEDHAADLDKTDAYLALARQLGIEV